MKLLIVLWISQLLQAAPLNTNHKSCMESIASINKNIENSNIFDMDVKVTKLQKAIMTGEIQNGLPSGSIVRKWKDGKLHYVLSNEFTPEKKELIRNAIGDIEDSSTCVTFEEHVIGDEPDDYVFVKPGSGCWSYIGAIGGSQELSLEDPDCLTRGTIIHEFLHALGIYHEQSRQDRDEHVVINWDTILSGFESNFEKRSTDSLGVEYDPNSVMHYQNTAFSKNGSDTIYFKSDPSLQLGGDKLTTKDARQLNLYYGCNPVVTTTTTFTTTSVPTATQTSLPDTTTTSTIATATAATSSTTIFTTPRTNPSNTTTPSTINPEISSQTPSTSSTSFTGTSTTPQVITTTVTTPETTTPASTPTTSSTSTTNSSTKTTPATSTVTTTNTISLASTTPQVTSNTTSDTTTTTTPPVTTTTTTPPPTTTTTPISTSVLEDCGDMTFVCIQAYYNQTYCAQPFYRQYCEQSCRLCDGGDQIRCHKFEDNIHYRCPARGQDGYCNSRNVVTRFYMRFYCPKTCCERGFMYG